MCILFNTLRPRHNFRYFTDNIFKCVLLNENVWILLKISLKFVPNFRINNIPALVLIMAWRQPGDKSLSELMMVSLMTQMCILNELKGEFCTLYLRHHSFTSKSEYDDISRANHTPFWCNHSETVVRLCNDGPHCLCHFTLLLGLQSVSRTITCYARCDNKTLSGNRYNRDIYARYGCYTSPLWAVWHRFNVLYWSMLSG